MSSSICENPTFSLTLNLGTLCFLLFQRRISPFFFTVPSGYNGGWYQVFVQEQLRHLLALSTAMLRHYTDSLTANYL